MMSLDPVGVSAAAKALAVAQRQAYSDAVVAAGGDPLPVDSDSALEVYGNASAQAETAVSAYLAVAGSPADEHDDATWICPACGCTYTCAGECGQNVPREGAPEGATFPCRATRVPIASTVAAASPDDERRAAGSMRRAADEPATPGEHLQWGKGWKVGRVEGQQCADERLREAAQLALDHLDSYLRGESGLAFVEPYPAARNAAEVLVAALAGVSAPAVRQRKPITAEEWAEGQPQAATAFPVAPPATGCDSCGDESVAVRPGECCAACRRAHERLEPAAPVFDQRRMVDVVAFVNWHAEGPCGCDGDPDDPCDSCRALALLASWDAAGVPAEAAPDDEHPIEQLCAGSGYPSEPPEGHHRPAPDALRDCYVCGRPQREHAGGAECDTPPPNPSPDEPTRYARRGFGIASGAPPVMSNMRAPEPEGDNPAITPPSNPYPFHEPLRVEHHSDEDKRQAWDEGYAAGVVAGRSIPSTGTGWDRGYAAGLAERDTRTDLSPDEGRRLFLLSVEQAKGGPRPTMEPISPRREES